MITTFPIVFVVVVVVNLVVVVVLIHVAFPMKNEIKVKRKWYKSGMHFRFQSVCHPSVATGRESRQLKERPGIRILPTPRGIIGGQKKTFAFRYDGV